MIVKLKIWVISYNAEKILFTMLASLFDIKKASFAYNIFKIWKKISQNFAMR